MMNALQGLHAYGWLASQAVDLHSFCRKGMHLALTAIYNLVLAPCLAERYKSKWPHCHILHRGVHRTRQ